MRTWPVICLVLSLLLVSCRTSTPESVVQPSEYELTANQVLERGIEAINNTASFHVSLTQTITTPEETFILSEWDGVTKRGYGLFVVARSVDPSSRNITEYEGLFLVDGKVYVRLLGSDTEWELVPSNLSESLVGSTRGLQGAIYGQDVDFQDTLQQYTDFNRASDEQFDGQSVYVLEGIIDVQTVLEQVSALGIPVELLESETTDMSMTKQILVRQNDYLPVRLVAESIFTFKVLDDELTIKWEGETAFSDFNAPVELPEVEDL